CLCLLRSVAGDADATMENLDCGARNPRLDNLADEPRRRRVIVAGDLNVVIGSDASPLPLGIPIRFCWQCFERWTIERLQQLAPALAELAHEIGDALPDCSIEVIKRAEASGARPCQHDSLNEWFCHLRFRFIPWLFDPRWQSCEAVMGGELLISTTDARLVARRLGEASLEVVADDRLGCISWNSL